MESANFPTHYMYDILDIIDDLPYQTIYNNMLGWAVDIINDLPLQSIYNDMIGWTVE